MQTLFTKLTVVSNIFPGPIQRKFLLATSTVVSMLFGFHLSFERFDFVCLKSSALLHDVASGFLFEESQASLRHNAVWLLEGPGKKFCSASGTVNSNQEETNIFS